MRLHDRGERLGGARVGEVAPLRHVGHRQMLLDQPGDAVACRRRQAEARAEPARDFRAGDRMILRAALGDVVQEGGDIERGAVGDVRQDLADQRKLLGQRARPRSGSARRRCAADARRRCSGDTSRTASCPTTRPKSGMKRPSTPASFMRRSASLGRAARGQDLQEQPVGFGVGAQLGVDALQRLRDEPRRVGMDGEARAVGDPIEADQIDRIALERVGVDDVDAVVVDLEVGGVGDRARAAAQAAEEAVERLGAAWPAAPRAPRRRSR